MLRCGILAWWVIVSTTETEPMWCLLVVREAKEKNRESWYMAYIMDTNDEERAKGKTVEVRLHYPAHTES